MCQLVYEEYIIPAVVEEMLQQQHYHLQLLLQYQQHQKKKNRKQQQLLQNQLKQQLQQLLSSFDNNKKLKSLSYAMRLLEGLYFIDLLDRHIKSGLDDRWKRNITEWGVIAAYALDNSVQAASRKYAGIGSRWEKGS